MTAAQTEILSDQSGYRKTAGERLRRAREIKGLSQKDVANALNLMVSHVRAIESNRYNSQAEGEHFGGYLRSYARLVELDPQQIIDLYHSQSAEREADTVVLAASSQASRRKQFRFKPSLIYGAAAVVCLMVVVWGVSQFGDFGSADDRSEVATSQNNEAAAQQDEAVAASEPSPSPAVSEEKLIEAKPEMEPEPTSVPNAGMPSATRAQSINSEEAVVNAGPTAATSTSRQQTRDIAVGAVDRGNENNRQAAIDDGASDTTGRSASTGKSIAAAARERRERVAAQAAADRSTSASLSNIGIQQRATRTNRQSSRGVNREADRRVQSEPGTSNGNQVAVSGSDRLVLDFTTDCWVEIYDANGAAVRLGVERAGEQLVLQGEAPFDVLVGFSRGVSMTLNGKPVSIRQHQFSDSTQLVVGGPDDYFGTQQTYDNDEAVAPGKSSLDELEYVNEDEIAERREEGRVIRERTAEAGSGQSGRANNQTGAGESDQQFATADKRVNVPARYSRPFATPAPSTVDELEKAARQSNSAKDDDRGAYAANDSERGDTSSLVEKQDQLEFTFSAECWVEVYDVEKRPLVMDTKYAGETLELKGQGPFEVRVGNSRAVSLKVNGQKIEIKRDRYIGSTEFFVGSR